MIGNDQEVHSWDPLDLAVFCRLHRLNDAIVPDFLLFRCWVESVHLEEQLKGYAVDLSLPIESSWTSGRASPVQSASNGLQRHMLVRVIRQMDGD